jgi:ligand-binding sensor domain-containing protein/signal transduction histidine kinase
MKILFIFVAILFFPLLLLSQSSIYYKPSDKISFEHITENNGLSYNHVTCILQDSKGFMWFGTKDGLNKYDGYSFTIYRHNPNDPFSIRQNYISTIYEDRLGILWIGTRQKGRKGLLKGSLNIFIREKDQFKHFIHNTNDSLSLKNSPITSISEDKSGDLWIATRSGIHKYNRKKEQFKFYNIDTTIQNVLVNRINVIYKSRHNKEIGLWIGTDKRLIKKIDINKEKSNIFKKYKKSNVQGILSMCDDNSDNLWYGTETHGLYMYDTGNKNLIQYKHDKKNIHSISHNRINTICSDISGLLWIGTNKGLNKFNQVKKQFVRYIHDSKNPYSLSNNKVVSVFEDNSGVIWIGTEGGGINKLNKQKNQFTYYKSQPSQSNSLSNNLIFSAYQDTKDFIWIGTIDGLNKFDPYNERFIHFFKSPNLSNSISYNKIKSIYEDKQGNMWFGTWGGGLNLYNRKTNKFKHYKHNSNNRYSISSNLVKFIFEDKKGIIWIGVSGGLNKFDPKTERFIHYKHNPNDPNSLSSTRVTSICETTYEGNEELWIGTHFGGLNKFNRQTDKFIHYKNEPADSNSLSNNNIIFIYGDTKGGLWCSTRGGLNKFDRENNNFKRYQFDSETNANDISKVIFEDNSGILWIGNNSGLFKYNWEKDNFKHYDEKYGIPSKKIDAILGDENENLWISSEKGITKFNIKTEKSIVYKIKDDLKNHVEILNAYMKCRDGKILFGGNQGFILFNPSEIIENTVIPKITLTEFQIFNKPVKIKKNNIDENENIILLDKHISEIKTIEFPYDKDVFSIEFSALDFRSSDKNKYAYKLEGVDPDWIFTDAARRFVTYNHVNPGEYVFHVKGSNNDGIWNEEGTSVKIIITPLWWQTAWFRINVILVIIGFIGWAFYLRIKALKKKHQVQEEFSRKLIDSQELERKRIASALHDSHGQNLLVISNEMQYFTNEHQEYKEDLKPVTEIIQESINEVRNISYALHPHQLDKLGLVKTIKSMVKKVSGSTDLKFQLTIDDIDDLFEKKVEINIYRIIQEATNNIIKYARATLAKIIIEKKIDSVNICISDNGRGFNIEKKLKEVRGLGLSGMHERAHLINAKLNLESRIGIGTTINISVPVA